MNANSKGVVDLIGMKAYAYTPDGDGKGREGEIPAELADAATKAHEALVEMIAEGNDALMEEFFAEGTLPVEHIIDGLKSGIRELRIFPVLCSSGLHNIGTDRILDFIADILPAPTEREAPAEKISGPSAFVFKTTADPFAGRITYFKVMSGTIKNDAGLQNINKQAPERLAHLSIPQGKTLQAVTDLNTGDLGRRCQTEGHPHRRHPRGQIRHRDLPPGKSPGALDRLCHRSQVAER